MQTATRNTLTTTLDTFIANKNLPESYRTLIERWYLPMLETIAKEQKNSSAPFVLGINGCQGSGKSTLASVAVELLAELFDISAVAISIDDFYLTLADRKRLAADTHPLLLTRGVPGTHDLGLANETLDQLVSGHTPVAVPQFNKAIDDRAQRTQWPVLVKPVDVIILEGWCMGATPQAESELDEPINELEEFEDRSGSWRRYVNQQLATGYQSFFQRVDYWVMLKAPSFDNVYRWRLEQEEALIESLGKSKAGKADYRFMSPQQIRRFIQYYQRITQTLLETLPKTAHCVFELNENREVVNSTNKQVNS